MASSPPAILGRLAGGEARDSAGAAVVASAIDRGFEGPIMIRTDRFRATPARLARAFAAAALLAALAGCGDTMEKIADATRPPPPLPPSPVAAAAAPAAAIRTAIAADVVGAWQMLRLPSEVALQVNVSPRFSETYQWLLIMADGRIGLITSPAPPPSPYTAASLAAVFEREPNWDAYTLVGGIMTVTTPGAVGVFAKRDLWVIDVVAAPGALLGLAVQPGDILMLLRGPDGTPIYRRIVRRIA